MIFGFTGCTGPLAVIGQIYGGADTITTLTTGKGATDAIISTGTNKDCRVHRIFKKKPMCKEEIIKEEKNEDKDKDVEDKNILLKTIGDIFNSIKFN